MTTRALHRKKEKNSDENHLLPFKEISNNADFVLLAVSWSLMVLLSTDWEAGNRSWSLMVVLMMRRMKMMKKGRFRVLRLQKQATWEH